MKTFLRYNTRHHLILSRKRGLLLNPCGYSFDEVSWDWSEPLWLFRFRQRVFCHAGAQRCGRRRENPLWSDRNGGTKEFPDTWDLGPDGNRTCSYCGSIHFDDLMKICRLVLVDERYALEGTTKDYKIYIRQPGVPNASVGAIKFYSAHAPAEVSTEDLNLYCEAHRLSAVRFEASWKARMAKLAGV